MRRQVIEDLNQHNPNILDKASSSGAQHQTRMLFQDSAQSGFMIAGDVTRHAFERCHGAIDSAGANPALDAGREPRGGFMNMLGGRRSAGFSQALPAAILTGASNAFRAAHVQDEIGRFRKLRVSTYKHRYKSKEKLGTHSPD
jgi:hypothetical protein